MWLSMHPWKKEQIRAVLQPFNITVLCATATLLFLKGAYDETALKALLVVIPAGLLATQIGLFVFKRLSNSTFKRLLIGLCLMTGLAILLQILLNSAINING